GIEKANEVMMPLFFCLFVGLAIYVFTLPGAVEGYKYIFLLDPKGLADPLVWVFALGQAFFSLSIAGNGTLIYGSYLDDAEDVPNSAKYVALFDTIAALLASLVIIPAMAVAGQQLSTGGPGLLFIYLPNLFSTMPGGPLIMAVFFVAVLFGGLTSLINFFEAPIATLQEFFHLDRAKACFAIGAIVLVASLLIQGIVSQWMDVCSIYLCPIGALFAAIMFYWFSGKDWVLEQVNKGRAKPLGAWYYPMGKYVFVIATVVVLVLGSALGGIG
ncbi:MAG: sodium-dependent transporter, partial [Coriobacteriales bacterium]|nr:sodium-dependent transporter [Coriobacteriales bacterium]